MKRIIFIFLSVTLASCATDDTVGSELPEDAVGLFKTESYPQIWVLYQSRSWKEMHTAENPGSDGDWDQDQYIFYKDGTFKKSGELQGREEFPEYDISGTYEFSEGPYEMKIKLFYTEENGGVQNCTYPRNNEVLFYRIEDEKDYLLNTVFECDGYDYYYQYKSESN